MCKIACTTQASVFGTWDSWTNGYTPVRLEVHWKVDPNFNQLYNPDAGTLHAKLEYDEGGGWQTWEEHTWNAWQSGGYCSTSPIACDNHVATHDLASTVSTGSLKVRATLTAQMTSCSNCSGDPSAVAGNIYVWDVRLIAAAPTLTVSPNPVTRGGSATFTVQGAPGATISNWQYSTTSYGTVTRSTSTGSSTWPGVVVAAGTGSVQVVLNGTTYNPSAALNVTSRSWTFSAPSPQEVPNGTFTTLPSPPVANGELGHSLFTDLNAFATALIADGGPNDGFRYVTSNTDNGSYFKYEISPDLENTSSTFHTAQCGNYNAQTNTGFISGAVLLSNVREHEYGTTLGHYQEFVAANDNPANNLGVITEAEIGGPGTSDAAFVAQVTGDSNAAINRINTAASAEPCNVDTRKDTSCTFRGYINFSPYQSCQ